MLYTGHTAEVVRRNIHALILAHRMTFEQFVSKVTPSKDELLAVHDGNTSGKFTDEFVSRVATTFGVTDDALTELNWAIRCMFGHVEKTLKSGMHYDALELVKELWGKAHDRCPREQIRAALLYSKTYIELGLYSDAGPWADRALDLAELTEDSKMIHKARHNRAIVYLQTGDYPRVFEIMAKDRTDARYHTSNKTARNAFILACAFLKQHSFQLANSNMSIALRYASGDQDVFIGRCHQVMALISRREAGSKTEGREALYATGKRHAQDALSGSLKIRNDGKLTDPLNAVYAYFELGKILIDQGYADEAIPNFEKALKIVPQLRRKQEEYEAKFYIALCKSDHWAMKTTLEFIEWLDVSPIDLATMYEKYGDAVTEDPIESARAHKRALKLISRPISRPNERE